MPTNPSRALAFNVNGASRSSNNTRIDGVSTPNVQFPHVAAYVPALESLETVNVVTNSFDAEQGLAGGSAINVQVKSGSNQFRGSAFEYHHNEALRSRDYFAAEDSDKGDFSYNQFGGTLGGPIMRNRLFFFGSYEGTLDRQVVDQIATVPTAALRRGDLSASTTPIYDPLTGTANGAGRTPFAGNQIPRQPHRPDGAVDHRPDSDAEPAACRRDDAGGQQLLRAGAVPVRSPHRRHQGQLERQQSPEHVRPLQHARLLHRPTSRSSATSCRVRRSPAVTPASARATPTTSPRA